MATAITALTDATTGRRIDRVVRGLATSDGDGVALTRVIGQPALEMLDPFLMLDWFESDDPNQPVAGFPRHPHRGFETITYLPAGRMRHQDSVGNAGVIESGGVQWMTAGRGVIHAEMPERHNGLLQGFQLWVNLPAAYKMIPPDYRQFTADAVPLELREQGAAVRVIAGETARGTRGPVNQPLTQLSYFDVTLNAHAPLLEPLPPDHNAFIYLSAGAAVIDDRRLTPGDLAVLTPSQHPVRVAAQAQGARFLLVAGKPLGEPVVKGGPFVMNTHAEIQQAFEDYRQGRLTG